MIRTTLTNNNTGVNKMTADKMKAEMESTLNQIGNYLYRMMRDFWYKEKELSLEEYFKKSEFFHDIKSLYIKIDILLDDIDDFNKKHGGK